MSNFDPKSPSYVPPGGTLVNDGATFDYAEGNQTAVAVLAAGTVLSASTAVSVGNLGCRGGLFMMDITSFPGSASTTAALKITVVDPIGGRTATLATRAAVSATGQALLMVYPAPLSASAGAQVGILPRTFNVKVSVSTGAASGGVTLSLTRWLVR